VQVKTYRSSVKRGIDLFVSSMLLLLLLPVLFVVATLVRVFLGRGVLYLHSRIGQGGQQFQVVKFRTMTEERSDSGELLPDEFRLTRFGRFLRSSSLDELPELWNVFCGEMSLVGPRPLLVDYLPLYSTEQARRHEVLPGITGLAQVRGRNAISWEEKFDYDVQYVDKMSFGLDVRILLETVVCVLNRAGISAESHATCPAFMGSTEVDSQCGHSAA
jgi:lipopolysaccharide/colanic/teichoic acid biosynthesis glycosyltransferase